jgi:hypothetical protein
MSLTRANVEHEACLIVGRLMSLVGLDGSTFTGNNASLNAPIRDGLQRMGYPLTDPAGLAVADSDLAGLNPQAMRRLLEWIELRVLEQVLRDWFRAEQNRPASLMPTVANGVTTDPLAGVRSQVTARVAELHQIVKQPYQSMNTPLAMGVITIGSVNDPSLPPSVANTIPPWALAPDGLWFYGCTAEAYWGWGSWV